MLTPSEIETYKTEVKNELDNILQFWIDKTFDTQNGGFIGKMDIHGNIDFDAPKGLVLNARILCTFSRAYKNDPQARYLEAAQRAYHALMTHFKDTEQGGYYWSIQANGTPLSMRKQIYGLAFVLYGLSEFYTVFPDNTVKKECFAIFKWIERNSFNLQNKGYLEALSRDGSPLADMRLSPKDRNDPLSMTTHLHILEAYTNLYRISKGSFVKEKIKNLITLFHQHIISKSGHLILFFNENWQPTDTEISYGHDIEAAWLILEAAEIAQFRVKTSQTMAVKIAKAVSKGLDTEGGLDYEAHRRERHWWVQAEGMVGFLNAFQCSKQPHFLEKSVACWAYVKKYFIDSKKGEWFWGYTEGGALMHQEDKVGFWKCPYHNVRACLEVYRRLSHI